MPTYITNISLMSSSPLTTQSPQNIMMLAEVRDYWEWDGGGAEYQYPNDEYGQPGRRAETMANEEWAAAKVMPALRTLIYRCLDKEPEYRPSLEELVATCESAVKSLTEKDFGDDGANETDKAVREFVKKFIYDADLLSEDVRTQAGRKRKRTRSLSSRNSASRWRQFKRLRRGVVTTPW